MTTEREPEADAVLRRELPNLRAAWRLARSRGSLDDAAAMIVALYDAIAYRDLVEIRGWAEELADDPALAAHPRAAAVLGTAAEAAYHRGDYRRPTGSPAPGSSRRPTSAGSWYCLIGAVGGRPGPRGVRRRGRALPRRGRARGRHRREPRDRRPRHGLRGRPRPGADAERAGAGRRGVAHDALVGRLRRRGDREPRGRRRAGRAALRPRHRPGPHLGRDLPRRRRDRRAASRCAPTPAGSTRRCAGYREVIDYFARTGNWTHLWATLRNLADLLRRLGDDEPAALLDAAADLAPDAPVVNGPRDDGPSSPHPAGVTAPATRAPGRAAVLETARRAIERHLARA